MRTINDRRNLVIDSLHSVINSGHIIRDSGHFVINSIRGLQNLRSGHPSLLLRQLVQPLQRVLDLRPSDQLP